jgi:hypothetical protein
MMIIAHPATFTFVQAHTSDTYGITWGQQRDSFYGGGGIPDCWFDGVTQCEGAYQNDTQQYNWYNSTYNTRMAVPTDVSITLSATPIGTQAYQIHANVAVDTGGASRTMRIYMVHALDNYPASSDHRYRNCLRPPTVNTQDVTLSGGQSIIVDRDFTFDATSWARQTDMRIIAWAQAPNASGPANIYNAAMLSGPFTPPPPMGDVNCDGAVNAFDIDPFIKCLISDSPTAPCTNCSTADIDENGDINAFDIDPFVQCVIDGGCP